MASTILLVLSAVLAFNVVHQTDAGWLPEFACNNLQNRFLRLGCYEDQSARCNVIYSQIVLPFLGIPACDFVTCNGYGNALGTCVANSACARANPDAFCETGQVCCEVLTTTTTTTTSTTTTTTTTQPPPDVVNGGGSSSDESLAADNMVDNGDDDSSDDKNDKKYRKAVKGSDSNESK